MNDFLNLLKDLWQAASFSGGIAVMLALLAVVSSLIWNLLTQFWTFRKQRTLKRDLFPFYTELEINRATQYYVETTCQNVAPSKQEEPGHTDPIVVKEYVIPVFLNRAFHPKKEDCQFYLVLADSGMGKTTFMINLYLRYINQFRHPAYRIKLFPLGFPGIDREIEKIPDDEKRRTILLLDAFDEDMLAVQDYKTRLENLVQKVRYFREVVLTCRTQFFPHEEEEPKETGVMRYGTKGGEQVFYKFYLSPFDEHDIQTYLNKRFPWLQRAKRQTAKQIVMSCPNLMVRPMLLSYIEDLLQNERPYTRAYMVYAELINKWVERETHKVPSERRKHYMEELYQFSREIAVYLYRHRVEHQGSLLISGKEIQPFADKHGIELNEMEMKSRSLLNRNAQGQYKFSHKSVLGYFLAEQAFFYPDFRHEIDFEGLEQSEVFFEEMIWDKLTVPFFARSDLKGKYSLIARRTRALTKLPEKILSEITYIKLEEWNPEDDVLLFRGLKQLELLDLFETQITSEQEKELRQILPTCQILTSRGEPLESLESLAIDKTKFSNRSALQESGNLGSSTISPQEPLSPGVNIKRDYKNPYIAGAPIKADNMFFGREDIFEKIRTHFVGRYQDNIVVISGQRRTGKTSILYQMEKHLNKYEERYAAVLIDVQGLALKGIDNFLWELARTISRALSPKYSIKQPEQTLFLNDARNAFRENFLSTIREAIGKRRLLLMFDEADRFEEAMINKQLEADFPDYFRSLMQHQENVSFIFVRGSKFTQMKQEHALMFNVTLSVPVSFLDHDSAHELVNQPVTNLYTFEDAAVERLLDITFCHPYYTQLLCQQLFILWEKQQWTTVTTANVESILEESTERAVVNFEYTWNESDPYQKLILATLAEIKRDNCTPAMLEQYLQEKQIPVKQTQIMHALEDLSKRELIKSPANPCFTVELLQLWLAREKPLSWMYSELQDELT